MLEIENENLLRDALKKGINLFLGAGFSILASGELGDLPLGGQFESELRSKFADLNLSANLDLSQISTIIKSKRRQAFRDYCDQRFTVTGGTDPYVNLFDLKIENVFTTNIDNLIPVAVDLHGDKYMHDVFTSGSSESDARKVNYFALHGCVNHGHRDYVFGSTEIASAYGDEPQLWNYFAMMLAMKPTLFWGYGMRDAGTLQAARTASKRQNAAPQWLLLHPSEIKNRDYYKALDFSIAVGETSEFLEFLLTVDAGGVLPKPSTFQASRFPEFQIPSQNSVPVRESIVFYQGAEPSWYDIFHGIPAETSHFRRLQNDIASGKDVMIQGVPASGKTALLKMLAASAPDYRSKVLYLDGFMDVEKAALIKGEIGDDKILIFWDNFFENVDAVAEIQSIPNAQIVAADRDYIFQFGFHRIDVSEFLVHDCSDLLPQDMQRVIEKIPSPLVRLEKVRSLESSTDTVSIFDVIQTVAQNADVKDRIRKIFVDLSKHDDIFKELFVLIAYFHTARVPASFDAVASYCGLSGYQVLEVHDLLARLGGLVTEYQGAFGGSDQDYFSVRSRIFAETCIAVVPPPLLEKVVSRVLNDISIVKIPHYSVFQRGAFRNEIFARAFPDWEEGLSLYDRMVEAALDDRSKPYIKQQCALYLAQKRRLHEAFSTIDEAVRLSHGRITTIRHTSARIKFEATINIPDDDDGYVRSTLFESMDELRRCYKMDRRTQRHAEYYGKFALQLDDKYSDDETFRLVEQANDWLTAETKKPGFNRRLNRLLTDIRLRISEVG